jgi:hypothetical protein
MGRAINKAVTIAEILKRKMPLHQINCLSSSEIVDIFEPLEEGLDVVESKRYVSCMTITLSITQEGIDVNDIGYQVCLPFVEIFIFILKSVVHKFLSEYNQPFFSPFISLLFHQKNPGNIMIDKFNRICYYC